MLTVVQEKLAEAHGLAIAAAKVSARLHDRIEEPELVELLEELRRDADQVRARCALGENQEMLAHANSTAATGADLVAAWFKAGTDPLRAWTFLAMSEAAEVAAWSAVSTLAVPDVEELAAWALPLQQRHLAAVLEAVPVLAATFEPLAPRWG